MTESTRTVALCASDEKSHLEAAYCMDACAVHSPALARVPWLVHGSTTRAFQAGLPNGISRITEMRTACDLLKAAEYPVICGQQKHTNNVAMIAEKLMYDQGAACVTFPETDALVTNQAEQALVIQTADCAPIFMCDPINRVIGLAHAGWKGTLGRIAQHTITSMTSLGAEASSIIAWIGPMACRCCYEVSNELIQSFVTEFGELPPSEVHAGRMLDLVRITQHQLENVGLSRGNIHHSGICTIHQHQDFYSYRADNGTSGRILSVIAMHNE